jgi:pyruvate ferredoxin oxidoreductase gamma subunit
MIDTTKLVEIRWHGRGGQGSVSSTEMLAQAAISEGKFAQAFPRFGAERRGAPVVAFLRINSKEPIKTRAEIAEPDVVVVLDPYLLRIVDVASGLKENGILIINTKKSFQDIKSEFKVPHQLATIDASKIAQELLGVSIVNTTMIGALIKATGVVKLESLLEPVRHRLGHLAERNINAMKKAYNVTVIKE